MNLLCRAPVREDVPYDPVVALLREEGDGRLPFMRPARATRPIWREVAPHHEAATGEDFAVRLPHVLLVRAVLSNAGHKGLDLDDGFVVVILFVVGARMRRPERVRLVLRPVGGAPGRRQARQPHGVAPRAEDGPPRQAPPAVGPARRPARHPKNEVREEYAAQAAGLRGHGRGVHAGGNGALGGDFITTFT